MRKATRRAMELRLLMWASPDRFDYQRLASYSGKHGETPSGRAAHADTVREEVCNEEEDEV